MVPGSYTKFPPREFPGCVAFGVKSVIAEVFPSIFKNRYPRKDRTADQQDAYCVARWLSETGERGFLKYSQPSLTDEEIWKAGFLESCRMQRS